MPADKADPEHVRRIRETAGSLADALRRQRDELRMSFVPRSPGVERLERGTLDRSELPRTTAPAAAPASSSARAPIVSEGRETGEAAGVGGRSDVRSAEAGPPMPWVQNRDLEAEAMPAGAGSAPASASPVDSEAVSLQAESLVQLQELIGDCRRCGLCERRSSVVFGKGDHNARLFFIGEGPGASEDRQGIPFVGRAGQLLDKMIAAMGLSAEEVYVANVVKCRPPGNRDPDPEEIAACHPFLMRQVALVQPEVIVTLGRFAAQTLLSTGEPISRLRGRWTSWRDTPVMPTFHPAYLLRNPQQKRPAWEDLQAVMSKLGLAE